jgi:hypothetical protein
MDTHSKTLPIRIIITALVLTATLFLAVVQAGPLPQGADPRPDRDGENPGGGGAGGQNGGTNGGSQGAACASVAGQIINWGFGGEGGVTTNLSASSWQVSTISASDGNYGYGGLGVGVATLHVSLAPSQAETLQPHIQDARIYLNCNYPTIANIALAGSPDIEPPVTLDMSVPDRLIPGQNSQIRLAVTNDLPNEITNVILTNLMPPGLIALDVAAASIPPGNAVIVDGGSDGQLVAVFLDKVPAAAEANVIITVTTSDDIAGSARLNNTATLFYRESIAVQASAELTIGQRELDVPVVSTPAGPIAEAEAAATAEAQVEAQQAPAPAVADASAAANESETEEEFVPPDDKLPGTGGSDAPAPLLPVTGVELWSTTSYAGNKGPGLFIPLGWLGIVVLTLLAYQLRSRHHDR